jgi:hypothetical protein
MSEISRATSSYGFWQKKQAMPHASQNGHGELSRLLNAAVVSPAFCQLLLTRPSAALRAGYNGEPFRLAPEEEESILSIEATSLSGFAQQLTQRWNGRCEEG